MPGHASFAVGLCLAAFVAVNILGDLIRPGFDISFLCMPLAPTRWWATRVLVITTAVLLGCSLVRPLRQPAAYITTQALLGFLCLNAAGAALAPSVPCFRGDVSRLLPPAYALCTALALGSQVLRIRADNRNRPPPDAQAARKRGSVPTVLTIGAVMIAFFAAQFFLLGRARRPHTSDCIVVMGAGVRWDGRPGPVLRDRILTACELYLRGYSDALVLSGGPVSDHFSEPRSMARFAREVMGVPARAIILDEEGLSTHHTVLNVRRLAARRGWTAVTVVTHDYHLSRTWLAFHRAGLVAHPYPAERRSGSFLKYACAVCRECAAWGYYFLRPLWEPRLLPNPVDTTGSDLLPFVVRKSCTPDPM